MKKHIQLILIIFPIIFFVFFTGNSKLIPSVDAQTADPYIGANVGSKINATTKLADFVTLPKTSTGGGTQTTACWLGANSAVTLNLLTGQGQKFLEKGYSYGWLAGIVVKSEDLILAEPIIDDLQKNGTNLIIRACYGGAGGCEIAPEGSTEEVIKRDAKTYALSTIALAEKSKYPFWIVGGHNEPNLVEIRTPKQEAIFLKTYMDNISNPKNYKADFYTTRAKINVLAPILADPTWRDDTKGIIPFEAYLKEMELYSANLFGGIVGYSFNVYNVESLTKVSNYVESKKAKAYITETGIEPATNKSITNKQFNQFRVDIINQFRTNPNIAAMLIFNGMLTDTLKKHGDPDDQKEAEKLLPNSYTRGVHGDKLEPTTYCSIKDEDPDCKDPKGWNIFYETQILSALSAAGCSNTFVRTCSYDKDYVKSVNKTYGESTDAYFDMVDPARSGSTFENLGIGKVERDAGCSERNPDGTCKAGKRLKEVWENVLKDAVFSSNTVNTVQIDVPLLRSIATTDPKGTDELAYTSYAGSLNRKNYQSNIDFTRKADGTAKVINIDGSTTQISVPLLGTTHLIYSRDFEDFTQYDRDVVREPLDFLKSTYNNKSSATDKRIEDKITNYGTTNITDLAKVGMFKSTGLDEFTVTPSSKFSPTKVIAKNLVTTKNNDVTNTQFSSSQVISGESIVRNAKLDSNKDVVNCSDFFPSLDVPTTVSADGYGTCEAMETPKGSHYLVAEDGSIVKDFGQDHFVTVSKQCFKAWCAKPETKKPLGTTLPVDVVTKKNDGKGTLFVQTGNSGSEMYFLKKMTYQGTRLDSVSALLRVMRTAWEESNRMIYLKDRRVCHKDISATVNLYTRQYTVSESQKASIKTGNNDQCTNPDNAADIGSLRPAIKFDDNTKSFVTSTAEIPFLGTVAAINERIAKGDYNIESNSKMVECGSADDKYPTCICREDNVSEYITKDPDPLAVFLCNNGMLTLDEIRKAKIDPKLCMDSDKRLDDYVDGILSHEQVVGIQSCSDAIKNPKLKDAISKASSIGQVPPGVIVAIWQQETSCSHVNTADPINDTSLYTENNEICKQRGCDVRGSFQFTDTTFASIIQNPKFNECRTQIGVDPTTTPLRYRWGDGLCANAVKLGIDGQASSLASWNDDNTKNAARAYLGACSDLGVAYCSNVIGTSKYYDPLFK